MTLDVEVEIKIPVTYKQFWNTFEMIRYPPAEYLGRSSHIDRYYVPAHRNFIDVEHPFEWLRVREMDGKAILNYKHFHPENQKIFKYCDEFETGIENRDQLTKILLALDFEEIVTVKKTRKAFLYAYDFEVALDDVSELGHFVEIESKKDFGGVDLTRIEVGDIARRLMLDPLQADHRGYPYLLMVKKGLIKS